MSLTPSKDRIHIAILGRMNAGKSTLLNLLTQSNTSIADATPGTTSDAKISFMQLHKLGPSKLFDCAGMDETGRLGHKKLEKTLSIAERADIIVHVCDADDLKGGPLNKLVLDKYNHHLRGQEWIDVEKLIEELNQKKHNVITVVNCKGGSDAGELRYYCKSKGPNVLVADLHNTSPRTLTNFISSSLPAKSFKYDSHNQLIPKNVTKNDKILLITPIDEEAPKQHLLRPQAMALEAFISNGNAVTLLNLDCKAARSGDKEELDKLRQCIKNADFVLTDSQAIDILMKFVGSTPFTTFSIQQIHYLAGQYFDYLVDSLRQFTKVKNPRVLISEACTHDRLTQQCEDIGTKQIPKLVKEKLNGTITFSFGKDDEVIEKGVFDLAIHCGGCMISKQQMQYRIRKLMEKNIPCTNYGMFLTWAHGGDISRVTKCWQ